MNAAAVLRLHAALVKTAERQRELADRFTRAHPGIPVTYVRALSRDA